MAPSIKNDSRQIRGLRRQRPAIDPPPKEFGVPYFAHQELDRRRFGRAAGLALPVGKPGWAPAPVEIATATNGGWDNQEEAPLYNDPDDNATAGNKHSSASKSSASKKLRVAGGRPAVAKRVTADLDSDDELIVRMKNAKYLEKDIAKRLAEEGRTAYNPKTIGTRWARIRKVLAERNDELLDAEVTDWHDGDDDALRKAYKRADEITQKAMADVEGRRWRIVADELNHLKPVTNFSQNACHARFQALQAGTAKPTPESIINPDEQTVQRIRARQEKEARIQADMRLLDASRAAAIDNVQGNAWTSKSQKYI